jgi:PhzF family phenazine biosynthesis protein
MDIPYFHIDAFTSQQFSGNPAGVCVLEKWLSDEALQAIAAENNLPETAFIVKKNGSYDLRWLTPTVEVDLCGHATLASAHVVFNHLGFAEDKVSFHSRSGPLHVRRDGDRLVLDFPSRPAAPSDVFPELAASLRATPSSVCKGRDYMAVFECEEDVARIKPDFLAMVQLDCQGVIVTAPGNTCDFVSRYFAPAAGIDEDPATGSTHCALIPYWAQRLNKSQLHARQLSNRGGEMFCEDKGDRVAIGGKAITFSQGAIHLPD